MPILPSSAEHVSRRFREADSESPLPSTRRETPQARRPLEPAATMVDRHVARQPPSSDYLAFLSNVGGANANANANGASAATIHGATGTTGHGANAHGASAAAPIAPVALARDAAVQARLDAVREAFSGPYLVDGEQVTARPMFRMTTHVVSDRIAREVDARGHGAGVNAFPTRVGQGTRWALVKVTHALIDAGRLPPGPGDVATRIRKMQWDHGIGVDCAGYSKQALAACSARVPKMYAPGMESFRDLDRTRAGSFAKQAIENARPGDLITLDGPAGGWGHNVVVYSHVIADSAQQARLGASDPSVRAFLSSPGPHHVIEVDSSWGAGPTGAEEGGYRRDTWLYDEATRTWGSFEPRTRQLVQSTRGPANDDYHGTYRPR
jgi:hypothetical protein